jgi:hypothetical protein
MLPGLLRTEHYRLEVSRRRAAAGSGETGGHTRSFDLLRTARTRERTLEDRIREGTRI